MKVMRKYVKHLKNLDFSNVIRKRGFMKKILLSLAALFLFNASANAATTIIENYDAAKLKNDINPIPAIPSNRFLYWLPLFYHLLRENLYKISKKTQ